MQLRTIPSRDDVIGYLRDRNNWNRWGADDQRGTINLITPEKRISAARLVQTGRSVSLSRTWPVRPAPNNTTPAQQWLRWFDFGSGGGGVVDFYGIVYHGYATTHIDALCHVWDQG